MDKLNFENMQFSTPLMPEFASDISSMTADTQNAEIDIEDVIDALYHAQEDQSYLA